MTHLATADTDLDFAARAARAVSRRDRAVSRSRRGTPRTARPRLRLPEARFDAARCGIALYGLSPFGGDALEDGLEPVLAWTSELAAVKLLQPGESTGYGRRFVAERDDVDRHRARRATPTASAAT